MTSLYSWSSRLNYILYNVMIILSVCGFVNHVTVRFGHYVGLRDQPIGLAADSIKFEL